MQKKIRELLKGLSRDLPEKEEALAFGLLALMAGESLFLLGPPGVAKSLVARRLKFAFQGAKAFEYLMGRFSTPEEIFGPLSIAGLRDRDVFERKTEGYLPDADVVFLDEIWRSSSPIQNALLTVLNEKVFRNGGREMKLPLKGLIGASNRLPEEDEGVEAFWDRFLIRLHVDNLESDEAFKAMVVSSADLYACPVESTQQITAQEWTQGRQAIAQITWETEALEVLVKLRQEVLGLEGFYVSDRRWKKIVHLLQTSAWLHDRTQVDRLDFFLIIPCLWNTEDQMIRAQEVVTKVLDQEGYPPPFSQETLDQRFRTLNLQLAQLTKNLENRQVRRPLLTHGEYYTLKDYAPDGQVRIWAEDYPLLKPQEDLECELYFFQGGSLVQSEKMVLRQGPREASVVLDGEIFDLESTLVWEEVYSEKPADPQALKTWAGEMEGFLKSLEADSQSLDQERDRRTREASEHLFIHPSLVTILINRLDRAQVWLEELKLKAKKLWETREPL